MLTRAYSTIEIKSLDDEQRLIAGIASTPVVDRQDDIVEPLGAKFTLPMPLLWQHRADQPIGQVTHAKVTKSGIEVTAQIAKGLNIPRIDEAWALIKSGLVRGLSIGMQAIASEPLKGGGRRFTEWGWHELSAVTIPANQEANILTVKSLDDGLAASGTEAPIETPKPAGASASMRVSMMRPDSPMKKSYAEQISGFEATLTAKQAKMDSILEKAAEAGVTLEAAEKEEHDTLEKEVGEIVEHLDRLKKAEARSKSEAKVIDGTTEEKAHQSRGGQVITVSRELPKGILFARYAMCIGASRGVPSEAMRLAKQYYPDDPGVYKLIEKGAIAGGSTTGSHYLDDMVPYNVMNDFIEYLRPGSIIGKFGGPNPGGGPNYPNLNRVGFNQRVSGMSTGYTAAWTGEGLPAIPTAAVTFNTTLLFHKLTALAILTREAIRFSNPSAEAVVRDDLARAVNAKMDVDFVDPANSGTANVKPASITDGIAATAPTGTTAAYFRTNLATMIAAFAQNNLDPTDIVLIMSAQMALQLSMMINTLGNNDFPDINMRGGMIRGFPVIVSEHLTAVGSPSTQTIIAVKAGDVYLADDGVVTVEASDQAAIEMQSTSSQSGISGTGASLVSLWQDGLVGLKAQREITWKLRRSTAVKYISPAAYAA